MTRGIVPCCFAIAGCSLYPDNVSPPADRVVDNRAAEAAIVRAIANDEECPELRRRNLRVECTETTVRMRGQVGSERERARAREIAEEHGGDRRIEDDLTVGGTP